MARYIWQTPNWPQFTWNSDKLLGPLGKARQSQGGLLGQAENMGLELQAEVLAEEALTTAAIEGEQLNRDSIRSSVARRLGLPTAGLPPTIRQIDGLIEMLVDATSRHVEPLSAERMKAWQAALFPTGYSGMHKIQVGQWRQGPDPMQVVSGPIGKEKLHYQAPPASGLEVEMDRFIEWWHRSAPPDMDGLVRAGVAHFWFVSIHPFDDGNGRIARAITDMALAQDEGLGHRLYSMSAQIVAERGTYYQVLERTQKGSQDITDWLVWFLACLDRSICRSEGQVLIATHKARFWQRHSETDLNRRQRKVVNRLLDAGPRGFTGGRTNRKYVGMTRVSRETAKRDMADLLAKGIVSKRPAGGRSVSYDLIWPERL